ncbi:hypothetical protein [Paracraurococcus lichenis]|uniref:Flagellar FliJ protein n=1 Tax=Paracraurococcus lichenis TaxID=3064888 RepID=A0ABT9E0G8_9PROT|nr:hypothetical protein [Paracraurococcus sp. LOR1-02]MDO9709645.1 hypothetical protein [Paracraurococcus sp. LOR1-02]
MARDALAALARLRRLETEAARRRVGQQAAQAVAAEARLDGAAAALRAEHESGAEAWRVWLARGLAERDRARLAREHAEARLQEAQGGLAATRAAERAVEALRERRAAEARRAARRREQALLDDAARRPRPDP